MIIPSYIGVISKNKLFDGGNGSIENPYRIVKSYHFDNMRKHPSAHYQLENDIIFTDEFEEDGEYYNDGKCWIPITTFTGSIDGQNYKIENAKVRPEFHTSGVLARTATGIIKNIYFKNVDVENTTRSFLGGVAGQHSSTSRIQNVFIDGRVVGRTFCGGILGRSSNGFVERCGVDMFVGNGHNNGGIIAGSSSNCNIYDCYTRGINQSYYHRGGIAGSTFGMRVYRSYSAMAMTGGHSWLRRGLISSYDGYNAYQEESYWDRQVTTTSSSFAGGTPMFTVEAKYPYQEIAGHGMPYQNWDFDNVWAHDVDGTINDGYPYLRNVTPIN